jgi:hypothetical protein
VPVQDELTLAMMLDGLDVFGAGLGLGAFKLALLLSPRSAEPLPLAVVNMLDGRDGLRAASAALGWGGGAWASTVMVTGRTNMPYPIAQSK